MRIWLCPNAWKESLTARAAAAIQLRNARAVFPEHEAIALPVADGGDGTLDALVLGSSGRRHYARVHGPRGSTVNAAYGVSGDGRTGFVEMARASGLALLPPRLRDPWVTTTRGTGELVRRLLDQGVEEIVLGVGGSATVDGGTGALRALGFRFLDRRGRDLPEGGGALTSLATIDATGADARLQHVRVRVACDVRNRLCGRHGAAREFGPQKGARPAQVPPLDAGLARLARVMRRTFGRDVSTAAGGGAAGGLAAGLMGCCDARLEAGAETVLSVLRFRERVRRGDLVITGEGKLDATTTMGKAPEAVGHAARRAGADVLCFCGLAEPRTAAAFSQRFGPVFPLIPDPRLIPEAMRNARGWLSALTLQVLLAWRQGSRSRTTARPVKRS